MYPSIVMQVIAAKPLAARESFELTSPKVKELGCAVYVHVIEHQVTHEGAHRISYAFEGKDQVKGWVTAIGKDGALNLTLGCGGSRNLAASRDFRRRGANGAASDPLELSTHRLVLSWG